MTSVAPQGLHHVTAIATAPQRNVDFYSRVLGLRHIKQTVNFDAPDSWHLYYGDENGSPSSILTFFPWPDAPRGRLHERGGNVGNCGRGRGNLLLLLLLIVALAGQDD